MQKQIDHMAHLLEKNNLKVLDNVKKTTSVEQFEKPPNDKGKGKAHVLVVVTSASSFTRVLDSGASYHMTSSKDVFTSMEPCNSPPILMGDDTLLQVGRKVTIDLDVGQLTNVLCVPSLSTNPLSIHQIIHVGNGK